MSLEVCVLASGSSGNSVYIASSNTRILIDAGLSAKQVAVRLEEIGVAPESMNGICVSHEHGDHVAGTHEGRADLKGLHAYQPGAAFGIEANITRTSNVE